MNKQEIAAALIIEHRSFTNYIDSLTDAEFMFSRNEKWTAGQQLDHLVRAVRPLTLGFVLPPFVFGLIFGKSNRKGRNFDELVAKYKMKLAAGGKASAQFIPPSIPLSKKVELINKLERHAEKLSAQVLKFSEKDLDQYILPHPLLGKLTIREMMYFTIYHTAHHRDNIEKALSQAH